MKKANFAAAALGMMLVLSSTWVFALISEEQREVLRGIEKVHVVIKRLKPEIEIEGLYRSTLQNDAELTLRMAGIKVIPEEEFFQTSDTPDLCLKVNALKCSNGYVYNIGLSLEEKVTLNRRNMQISATSFKIGEQLGIAPRLSDIRDEVRDLLEEFVRAWREANNK